MTPTERKTVCLHGNPDELYPVPPDSRFVAMDGESDYYAAPDLETVAGRLVRAHSGRLGHLADLHVVYLWKREGGKKADQLVFGKCIKLSGLAKHGFGQTDVCIWLAADHCRSSRFTRSQVEALLFHEMLHTTLVEGDDEDKPDKLMLLGHDLEMFDAEVEEYGFWRPEIAHTARVMAAQLPLELEQVRAGSLETLGGSLEERLRQSHATTDAPATYRTHTDAADIAARAIERATATREAPIGITR